MAVDAMQQLSAKCAMARLATRGWAEWWKAEESERIIDKITTCPESKIQKCLRAAVNAQKCVYVTPTRIELATFRWRSRLREQFS